MMEPTTNPAAPILAEALARIAGRPWFDSSKPGMQQARVVSEARMLAVRRAPVGQSVKRVDDALVELQDAITAFLADYPNSETVEQAVAAALVELGLLDMERHPDFPIDADFLNRVPPALRSWEFVLQLLSDDLYEELDSLADLERGT